MADELSLQIVATLTNGELDVRFAPGAKQYDQTTQGSIDQVVTVNTSAAETISFGDISTPGFCFVRNLDPSNYVTLSSTGGAFSRVEAGEIGGWRLDPSMTLSAQADTAACKVQFVILSD